MRIRYGTPDQAKRAARRAWGADWREHVEGDIATLPAGAGKRSLAALRGTATKDGRALVQSSRGIWEAVTPAEKVRRDQLSAAVKATRAIKARFLPGQQLDLFEGIVSNSRSWGVAVASSIEEGGRLGLAALQAKRFIVFLEARDPEGGAPETSPRWPFGYAPATWASRGWDWLIDRMVERLDGAKAKPKQREKRDKVSKQKIKDYKARGIQAKHGHEIRRRPKRDNEFDDDPPDVPAEGEVSLPLLVTITIERKL